MIAVFPALPFILAAAGFLAGSIPTGYLLARAKGVNIRDHGSGNIGATNVGRILGKRLGITCFILDVLKGLVPAIAAAFVLGIPRDPSLMLDTASALTWLGVAAATILGHIFTPWLGFKGGKGVATGLGALLGVFPFFTLPVLVAAIVWIVSLRLWRYVGLSSVLAAAVLPFAVAIIGLALLNTHLIATPSSWTPTPTLSQIAPALAPYIGIAVLLALVVIARHRGNLARIRNGTEPRVGWIGKQ